MAADIKITSDIDANFIDSAEEELFQILLEQRLFFNRRWYNNPLVTKVMPILRVLGLLLSILGLLGCVAIFILKPSWDSASYLAQVIGYTLFFIGAGLIFYFFPHITRYFHNYIQGISTRSCKKRASKCVKVARKLAPYLAQYDIKGGLISYYRCKNDVWKLAWSRKLRGVAIHGKSATLFFRKRTSIEPIMVLLHQDVEPFETLLNNLDIEHRSVAENRQYFSTDG